MTTVAVDYAGRSGLLSTASTSALGLSTNERRPVRFHAKVSRHVHSLKLALQTLGELVWSHYQWMSEEAFAEYMEMVLDPVITVHPDRIFFEAFSQDLSTYGLVIADRGSFEPDGEVSCGTTNIDFTKGLWKALEKMRSSRETSFGVGPTGFGVSTDSSVEHYEDKVDLPVPWVRGFLQLQGAMAMPGTRLTTRPVDMASTIRYLRHNVAYKSPRSLRFEFEPGQDTRLVLEPWDHVINLKGTEHRYTQKKTTRVWGRNRLELIEPLLPWASAVNIYLKGRALPAFYAVELPGVTFVLGLSGWTGNNWTQSASFDLLTSENVPENTVLSVLDWLSENYHGSVSAISEAVGLEQDPVSRACAQLCRRGRAIYDVQAREYRHRELFESPINLTEYFPPEPRKEAAVEHVRNGQVTVENDAPRKTEKAGKTFEDRQLDGMVAGEKVHLILQSSGRIIFGRCTCPFFDENLMNKGPCEHMLALRRFVDVEIGARS